ncbi:MAG: TIGR04283 family arsenosugar biosynthesis glycosyltransferase [Alphaproteobacteria bacterium]
MLSVIIPTLNAESTLPQTLSALIPGVVSGLVKDVIISDGGSADASRDIAEDTGCKVVTGPAGRGAQLARGALAARGNWLLFLHADTVLSPGWEAEAGHFMEQNYSSAYAGVFRFALDDFRPQARHLERLVSLRCKLFALPYGDQGLLIHRGLYDQLGGYANIPLMEDVDLIRRIGRRRLIYFRSTALTSAARYAAGGYLRRPLHNLFCLSLYFMRVPPRVIARLYG